MTRITAVDSDRILIVGAGMAGSLLALVLGRAGYAVTIFDLHANLSPMFRNEKLAADQIETLRALGVLDCFEAGCWPQAGHPDAYPETARPDLDACGAPHHLWLKAVRDAWPDTVTFMPCAVADLILSDDQQSVITANNERIKGRLVVLASGRLNRLHQNLGLEQTTISAMHSVCLGFSLKTPQPMSARIYKTLPGYAVSHVSLFPMPGETRVNVFSYRPLNDPWTRRMSQDPLGALAEISPAAARDLKTAELLRRCEARGTDLYTVSGHIRSGIVLIGDAFHAPCPASGSGMSRILNDIQRLAEVYIPQWLESPGMDRDKIAEFYGDRIKKNVDTRSLRRSLRGRNSQVGQGLHWRAWQALRRVKYALKAG